MDWSRVSNLLEWIPVLTAEVLGRRQLSKMPWAKKVVTLASILVLVPTSTRMYGRGSGYLVSTRKQMWVLTDGSTGSRYTLSMASMTADVFEPCRIHESWVPCGILDVVWEARE